MHQVPNVPMTAEKFFDVRIVLVPKSEEDQMTFYLDVGPPHFFSATVKDKLEWQILIQPTAPTHQEAGEGRTLLLVPPKH